MEQDNKDEIDIFYLLKKVNEFGNQFLIFVYKTIQFILKKWKVVLLLIVIGSGYGYYMETKSKQLKESNFLVKVNFDLVDYVYKEIDIIQKKLAVNDLVFIENIGLRKDSLEILSLEITPVVNLKDIVNNYGNNSRYLDGFIRNLKFKTSDIDISETFNSHYNYHKVGFLLSEFADENSIKNILSHINNNNLLLKIKKISIENMKERMANNIIVVNQIDKLLDKYSSNESLYTPSDNAFVIDKDFNLEEILQKKITLLNENRRINKELIFSEDIIIPVNNPYTSIVLPGITSKKMIIYPILLVFSFLIFSFFKRKFESLIKI